MEISITDFSAPIRASVLNFLLTPSGRQSVLCQWKLRCLLYSFCLLFQFHYSFFHSYIIHMDIFSVKDFSATTRVRILKFGTKLDSE